MRGVAAVRGAIGARVDRRGRAVSARMAVAALAARLALGFVGHVAGRRCFRMAADATRVNVGRRARRTDL